MHPVPVCASVAFLFGQLPAGPVIRVFLQVLVTHAAGSVDSS